MTGCAEKKYIKEVISEKNVTISLRETYNEKYLVLLIPVEFELNLNKAKIFSVVDYYSKNNKYMFPAEDYIFVDVNTNKIMLGFDRFKPYHYPKNIYLLERKRKISEEEALLLIQKYNPTAHLDNIKRENDTIKLVSYKQYREDNPKFLEEMRKISDTLTLSISISGKDENVIDKLKINW